MKDYNFTRRADDILRIFAVDEAKETYCKEIDPEHILLGMIKEGKGLAIEALMLLKVNLLALQKSLKKKVESEESSEDFFIGIIKLSKRSKEMLEISKLLVDDLGYSYIGTEHMLLACSKEKESVFCDFLAKDDIDDKALMKVIFNIRNRKYSSEGELFPSSKIKKEDFSIFNKKNTKKSPVDGIVKKRINTPNLNAFSQDFTKLAMKGELNLVAGREKEIDRFIQILSRKNKNNPILIGDPGVGKTAIVEGFAQRIVSNKVPVNLMDKRVLSLDLAAVVAGTKYRGEFEERLKKIMKEVKASDDVIIFIDEIHTLIHAGSAEGSMDAANILKPALSRGEMRCIGATTLSEYKKYIEKDMALERRFQKILIREPTKKETFVILDTIKPAYEKFHGVKYSNEAIEAILNLSKKYINDRLFPDKAIDILDEAGSKARIHNSFLPATVIDLEEEIVSLNKEKEKLVNSQEYESAAKIRDKTTLIRRKINMEKKSWRESLKLNIKLIKEEDIYSVISEVTGVPLTKLNKNESQKLLEIADEIKKEVIGQDNAIEKLANAIRRNRIGIKEVNRPFGSFIFLGSTGIGKTLLAKSIAKFLFDTDENFIRIDMSDYMEKINVSRLVGAPPGYIGYEEGGVLTEKVRRRPYSLILLDEIEKAHPDVFNLLLQVLEEGELQDNLGNVVSFKNCIIIMTSNIGVSSLLDSHKLGFSNIGGKYSAQDIKSNAMSELKKHFKPEFINRLDDIIIFDPLTEENIKVITKLHLDKLKDKILEIGYEIQFSNAVVEFIAKNGYELKYGARSIKRAIQHYIEDELTKELLQGKFKKKDKIKLSIKNDKVVFSLVKKRKAKKK